MISILLSVAIRILPLPIDTTPVSSETYKFNFSRNFYKNINEEKLALLQFNSLQIALDKITTTKKSTVEIIPTALSKLNDLEMVFRKLDLYYFLQYAVNTNNQAAAIKEDSLYEVISSRRNNFKYMISQIPEKEFSIIWEKPSIKPFRYYLKKIKADMVHAMDTVVFSRLKPFRKLIDTRFYDQCIQQVDFGKMEVDGKLYDLWEDQQYLEQYPDTLIATKAYQLKMKAYDKVKINLGYEYIHYIQSLNAFSEAKKYQSLINEKFESIQLSQEPVEKIFEIISKESQNTKHPIQPGKPVNIDSLYPINFATTIIKEATADLGIQYQNEMEKLMNPANGRIDIHGGSNRLPMEGVASVYPIGTSIFFAEKYKGYFRDLMLLAHEAGHAVQASMMYSNKVPMLNSSGPAYFTEAFGKFNELLVSYYLSKSAADTATKAYYFFKFKERLVESVLGSAQEAFIEYQIVKGIQKGDITQPNQLDTISSDVTRVFNILPQIPENRNFWMAMNTMVKAPLHNINDMLASLLAIHFFKSYLNDPITFKKEYAILLSTGYNEAPEALLNKRMGINWVNLNWVSDAFNWIRTIQ